MSEIVIINKFRDDAVLVTQQNEQGYMWSDTADFVHITNPTTQMFIALAQALDLDRQEDIKGYAWAQELIKLVKENDRQIIEQLDEWFEEQHERKVSEYDDNPDDPAEYLNVMNDDGYAILDDVSREDNNDV